jgi:RNA polymerase sigma-70 factor (ECF subfamily)
MQDDSPAALARATASNPAETDALVRARAGDHQGFAQIYSLHKRRIYSLCQRMVGNIAEAEDLMQEVFLQLHRKIGTFRGDSAFSTWLHRMAINVVLMHLRKKGLAVVSLDESIQPAPYERPARSFGGPDPVLSGAIDRLALERAIGELPTGYREIFVLHDREGLEHNEIASKLGCSVGNSKSQLHKARLKLREVLRAYSSPEGARPTASQEPATPSCRKFQAQLPGLIGTGKNLNLHPHIQSCELCRALLIDLQTIAEAARNLFPNVEPPEELWQHIESAIRDEETTLDTGKTRKE